MKNSFSNPVCSAISMCRKAGKLEIGFDVTETAVKKKTAKLVVIALDASPRTEKNILMACEQNNIRTVKLNVTMELIELSVGRKFAVAAVLDENFAKLIETKAG